LIEPGVHGQPLTSKHPTQIMASFIARVELHGGTSEDYEALHKAMATLGFARALMSDKGPAVQLPSGQYFGIGDLTASQVSEFAQGAALKTKKGFAVFVSDFTNAAWFGLDPVETPAPAPAA
jgi:hypothetical protein